MNQGKRITLLRAGKPKRKFILPEPPFPEIGDTCQLEGETWIVLAVEDCTILLRIPVGRTLEEPVS